MMAARSFSIPPVLHEAQRAVIVGNGHGQP